MPTPRLDRLGVGSAEPLIHSLYARWWAAIGTDQLLPLLAETLAPDFVYTDPAVVLLGRDLFLGTLPELELDSLKNCRVTVRDMGAHAVAAGVGACTPARRAGRTKYVFSALWRQVDGAWLCAAHRGAPTLLSGHPVGR